jgi:RNA polymerase sigma factor (sigma-70 family)
MKNELTIEEAEDLVCQLFNLRKIAEKDKSKQYLFKRKHDECVKRFDYLVEGRASRYRGFSNYEDLCQDGRLALCSALRTYEPGKGNFFWWANKYIQTKLSREANRHSTIKIPLKHAKDMTPYKVSKIPVMIDYSDDASETIQIVEKNTIVQKAVSKLPEDQRRVIELHFEMGNKQRLSIGSICKKMGISRMTCAKLLDDAKIALHQELAGIEL